MHMDRDRNKEVRRRAGMKWLLASGSQSIRLVRTRGENG